MQASILIADDDYISRLVLQKILEKNGYSVASVNNGLLAVEEFKRKEYQVVILDNNMPVMKGWQAAHVLKGMGSTAKVIALTGSDSIENNTWFDAILVKPIHSNALINTINRLLGRTGLKN